MAEQVSPIFAWVEKCREYRKSILSVVCGNSIGTGWIAAAGGPDSPRTACPDRRNISV